MSIDDREPDSPRTHRFRILHREVSDRLLALHRSGSLSHRFTSTLLREEIPADSNAPIICVIFSHVTPDKPVPLFVVRAHLRVEAVVPTGVVYDPNNPPHSSTIAAAPPGVVASGNLHDVDSVATSDLICSLVVEHARTCRNVRLAPTPSPETGRLLDALLRRCLEQKEALAQVLPITADTGAGFSSEDVPVNVG
eukprot:TRINITY_DN4932_c0_g1_i1.p2 TRINITY_DN4932_c0_g1~~TRINITY_DN4932_c0_g1_i1.p2  ORF type:complete len:195 (+),score=5.37 TRINITY_DN4932_c0_g1_i1:74-658(+)